MATILNEKSASTSLDSKEKIAAAIGNIYTKGMKLNRDCHEVLVAIFDHYAGKGSGDRSQLNDLLCAVADVLGGSKAQAMVQWVNDFIPSLKYNADMKTKPGTRQLDKFETVDAPKKGMTAEEWTEFRGIKDVPEDKPYLYGKDKDGKKMAFHGNARKLEFFLLEREVSTKPFDLMATIISLVKRAEKVREDQIKAGEKPTVALAQIVELKKLSEHIKEYKDPAPEIASVEKQEETNLEILQVEGEQEGEKQEETLVGAKVPETNPDANQEEKAA